MTLGGEEIPGVQMPTAIIPFDIEGTCKAPETRDAVLRSIGDGGFSHIIFMSHGWNTDYAAALKQYGAFLKNFEEVAGAQAGFKPVFVGVSWPSVWFPLDKGPVLAEFNGHDAGKDLVGPVAEAVAEGAAAAELDTLLRQPRLTRAQVERAVALALPALQAADDSDLRDAKPVEAEEVVRAVAHMQAAEQPLDVSGRPGTIKADRQKPTEAQIAGGLDMLDPKHLLRLFSVYKMKDRAGKVGAHGVADLLRDLTKIGPPVHLTGHSFGAKVMLSAVAAGAPPDPKPATALLLQPAISHLCFATEVKGRDGHGGYFAVLDERRIAGSIFSTYSRGDTPLHDLFHLALRRPADLGEIRMATEAGEPPSVYCALGGYGPRGSRQVLEDPIHKPGDGYGSLLKQPLAGLDGSAKVDYPEASNVRRVASHGDVANPYTAWALFQQMKV